MNGSTTQPTASKRIYRPRTGWELSELVRPLAGRKRHASPPRRRRVLPYYPQIVLYVFRSRFATGDQVARRFAEHLPSERTAQRRLAHLVELGHLAVASVRSTAPYFPHVYLATAKGVRWIKQLADERGLTFTVSPAEERRERGRALDSILHELLLTELELAAYTTVRGRGDLALRMTERRYFRRGKRLEFRQQGRLRSVVPDAGFLLAVSGQGSGGASPNPSALLMHFCEMDNATMSLPRVLLKLQYYDLWAHSDVGQQYLVNLYQQYGATRPRPNFRLVIVCHDKAGLRRGGDARRLLDVFTLALELPSQMRERVWLTTVERLRAHQDDEAPLSASVWVRVRDAQPWLAEYRAYTATLPLGRSEKRYHRQRQFVADRFSVLPAHPLLPRPAC